MRILVFNCGSSSLKFEFIEVEPASGNGRRLARGIVEGIGRQTRTTLSEEGGRRQETADQVENHEAAAMRVLDWLGGGARVDVVAHRVVHGGAHITAPVVADDEVLKELEEASRFAPLHNGPALATIRAVAAKLAGVAAVIVADTIFHHGLPAPARTYAIPRALAERYGIRRFGFHGIGHAWMLERYAAISGVAQGELNLVTLQLGAGCSAAAIRAGQSVDTSMGLTPLEGLMMATRSGDLDPAIFSYLASSAKMAPAEVERILNHESGLLGVSASSSDMRELEAAAGHDEHAALAIEMFCYRVRKYIGAYMAVLGRTDAIVFGGGIGEHSAHVREHACAGLERLGVLIDAERNRAMSGREGLISSGGSPVKICVVPLDEELWIARAAARLMSPAVC